MVALGKQIMPDPVWLVQQDSKPSQLKIYQLILIWSVLDQVGLAKYLSLIL